jgi:hypothetical protein
MIQSQIDTGSAELARRRELLAGVSMAHNRDFGAEVAPRYGAFRM